MISLNEETPVRTRIARMLAAAVIVGVEATWLGALVAVAVWLLFLR
jgi:hypothetical protein